MVESYGWYGYMCLSRYHAEWFFFAVPVSVSLGLYTKLCSILYAPKAIGIIYTSIHTAHSYKYSDFSSLHFFFGRPECRPCRQCTLHTHYVLRRVYFCGKIQAWTCHWAVSVHWHLAMPPCHLSIWMAFFCLIGALHIHCTQCICAITHTQHHYHHQNHHYHHHTTTITADTHTHTMHCCTHFVAFCSIIFTFIWYLWI